MMAVCSGIKQAHVRRPLLPGMNFERPSPFLRASAASEKCSGRADYLPFQALGQVIAFIRGKVEFLEETGLRSRSRRPTALNLRLLV